MNNKRRYFENLPGRRFCAFREAVLKTYRNGLDSFEFQDVKIQFSGPPDHIEALSDIVIGGVTYALADKLRNIARLAGAGYLGKDLVAFGTRQMARRERARQAAEAEAERRKQQEQTASDIRSIWPEEYADAAVAFHARRNKLLRGNWRRSGREGERPHDTYATDALVADSASALLRALGARVEQLNPDVLEAVMQLACWIHKRERQDES